MMSAERFELSEERMTEIYRTTVDKAYFVARKALGNDEDAIQDVLQDSYIKAFKAAGDYVETGKLQGWIDTIVIRTATDHLRKKNAIPFSVMEGDDDDSSGWDVEDELHEEFIPEAVADKESTRNTIDALLQALPAEQRLCLMNVVYEGKTAKETAEELGVSENTVKSRLRYAKEKLKDEITALEKKGVVVRSVAPIPLLLWLLRMEADASAYTGASLIGTVTAANAAAAGAAGTSGTAAAATGLSLGAKIGIVAAIGAVAAGITIGGFVIKKNSDLQVEAQKDERLAEDNDNEVEEVATIEKNEEDQEEIKETEEETTENSESADVVEREYYASETIINADVMSSMVQIDDMIIGLDGSTTISGLKSLISQSEEDYELILYDVNTYEEYPIDSEIDIYDHSEHEIYPALKKNGRIYVYFVTEIDYSDDPRLIDARTPVREPNENLWIPGGIGQALVKDMDYDSFITYIENAGYKYYEMTGDKKDGAKLLNRIPYYFLTNGKSIEAGAYYVTNPENAEVVLVVLKKDKNGGYMNSAHMAEFGSHPKFSVCFFDAMSDYDFFL